MENILFPLDKLLIGRNAIVRILRTEGQERRRFLDLGLAQGTSVKALHKSPSGDPTAYSIMGAVIALRNEDASKILVESH